MKIGKIEAGSGQPILFLHGIGGNAAAWQAQIAHFGRNYRAIGLDLPGYGETPPLLQMSFPALSAWLHEALSALGAPDPILIGNSFGGMIVQEYMATYSEPIRAVVLYGTSPAFGRKEGDWQQQFVRARLQPLDDGKSMVDLAPKIARGLVGSGALAEGVSRVEAGIAAVPTDTFRAAVHCLLDFDQRANLGKIKIPTLVLVGEEDSNAPAPMMKKMASKIIGANYVCLPTLGHVAHAENPAAFNAALDNFLASV